MKRSGLGKGIDAMIPPVKKAAGEESEKNSGSITVDISSVEPNRSQPRKTFDEDSLKELADSIKQVGVLQPVTVREISKGRYEIIAGERRWRASRKAGLKKIPVEIRNDLSEQQIVEIQLIENIQREDLNPIEEAKAYERLISEFHMKQDDIASRVSKSRVAVTNTMRLLKLCPDVQQMVIDEMLTTGHARALIPVEDAAEQYKLALRIFNGNLSVRETEKIVRDLNKPVKPKSKKETNASLEAVYLDLAERVKRATGTKVVISPKGNDGAGKIEIEFYSSDDLERITDMIILQ